MPKSKSNLKAATALNLKLLHKVLINGVGFMSMNCMKLLKSQFFPSDMLNDMPPL